MHYLLSQNHVENNSENYHLRFFLKSENVLQNLRILRLSENIWGLFVREKKAHKHKLFARVNVQMALGQTAGCPRVNRAKKFMCSPRNTGNINFSLWLTSGLSQGCPDFQRVYVFKVYVPFSCLSLVEETSSPVEMLEDFGLSQPLNLLGRGGVDGRFLGISHANP